jgi:inner membrane protein
VDNLTHTLFGLVLADAAAVALPKPPSARVRGLFRVASAVGNNFPDLDFLYAKITPGKLGYLLHHRGHTHTLLAAVVLGALTFALLAAWGRRRAFALSRVETLALAGLSLFGPFCHVGMDALNNYGVHPFWPAHDGWFYGDALFIVEPWFWVFSIPPLALASATRWGRIVLALCLAGGLILAWVMPVAGWPTALLLTLGSAATLLGSVRLGERGRAILGLGGVVLVTVVFAGASRLARATLLEAVNAQPSSSGLVNVADAVLTPLPANPICWQGIVVGRHEGMYRLEVAVVSIAPESVPASDCRIEPIGASLGLTPSSRRVTRSVSFQGEHQAPLAELRRLARSNCHAAAFLRFARTPFFRDHGTKVELGDLRYDRSEDEEFAELEVPARPVDCPQWLPPWTPPRRDLLEATTE